MSERQQKMASMSVEELYEKHIEFRSSAERLRLLAMTAQSLLQPTDPSVASKKRSIMELHGLGAEIWRSVDAQKHVDQLREEWDHRP